MEKEQKYKDALERAKAIYQGSYKPDTAAIIAETLRNVFPELEESEDERIRKSLIDMLKNDEKCYLKEIAWLEKFKVFTEHGDGLYYFSNGSFTYLSNHTLDNISCLEKQGEHKPFDGEKEIAELKGSEDEWIINSIIVNLKGNMSRTNGDYTLLNRQINWLKKQGKQKYDCSEDDEKIRKELINAIQGLWDNDALPLPLTVKRKDDWLAWLEKQGERKLVWSEEDEHRTKDTIYFLNTAKKHYASTVELDACIAWVKSLKDKVEPKFKNSKYVVDDCGFLWNIDKVEPKFKVGDKIRRKTPSSYDKDMQVARIEEEYYICNHIGKFSSEVVPFSKESCYELVEHKYVDKVEPKFREGDWIISNNKKSTYQVIEVKRGIYVIRDNVDNHEYHIGIEEANKSGRLWSIKDAKDGDVLLFEGYYNSIVLFQGIGINGKGRINYHCKCDLGKYSFGIQGDVACLGTIEQDAEHYHPATKEQRKLLFQKMYKAGYEWNDDEKKLNKIKTKEVRNGNE